MGIIPDSYYCGTSWGFKKDGVDPGEDGNEIGWMEKEDRGVGRLMSGDGRVVMSDKW